MLFFPPGMHLTTTKKFNFSQGFLRNVFVTVLFVFIIGNFYFGRLNGTININDLRLFDFIQFLVVLHITIDVYKL